VTKLRRFLIGLLALAFVVVALDFGLRLWAESWVGDRVQAALGLSKRPSISFGGVLFTPEVASGSISAATITAEDFTVHGVPFARGELHLRTVTFSAGKLLLHHQGAVRARAGDGVLVMTDRDLTAAFHRQGIPVTIRFSGGLIRVSADRLPAEVDATASIEGGSLVIRPTAVALRFPLDLPELGPGIRYRSVSIGDSEVRLFLGIDHARLAVS
jgi:hypothetical protein